MADYFDPNSLNEIGRVAAGPLANSWSGSPFQAQALLQNQAMANQGNQQALMGQSLGLQEQQQKLQELMAGAPGRMAGIEATNAAMTNPQYAQMRGQEIYSQMQGGIGKGAQEYLNAQLPAYQQLLGGAANTGDQAAYSAGKDRLHAMGFDTSNLPEDVGAGQKYLQGIGQSYQYSPSNESRMAGLQAQMQARQDIAEARNQTQRDIADARIQAEMDRLQIPKNLQGAIVMAQRNGDTAEVNRLIGIAGKLPQYNPEITGAQAEAKRSPFQQFIEDQATHTAQINTPDQVDALPKGARFRYQGKLYYK